MHKHLLLTTLFFPLLLLGQEQFGAAFSNYTPTNSVHLNPSSMLDAKTWLDIHIVGAGVYANNNLVSLNNTNYTRIARTNGTGISDDNIQFHHGKNKYHAYVRGFAEVLSAVWSQGNHAVGFSLGARSFTTVRGIPGDAVDLIEKGLQDSTIQNRAYSFSNIRAASLNFAQIQLSYGYTFYRKRRDMMMGGISIKKFLAIGGGAASLYNINGTVLSDTTLSGGLQGDVMYTPQPHLSAKGGFGFDLGFTYQKMMSECTSYYPNSKKMGCRYLPYKYKLGVSLMDIGSVKFDKSDISANGYTADFFLNNYSNIKIDDKHSVSEALGITSGDTRVKKPYKMRLPTYISIQGDYNLWASRLYANASIVQGMPLSHTKFGIRRANSLMIGLRFETKIFDISLPVSLYEYRVPQVGLAVRIYCLTIGTDKLLHFMGNSNLYGGDIYAHLKIPIFYNPKCKAKNKRGGLNYQQGRLRRKKNNGCDAFN